MSGGPTCHSRPGAAGVFASRLFPARWRGGRGFTLIELLVVCALVAILSGGLAMALRDGGGNSLATAQTTVATLVGTARAQAAVHQTEALLAIVSTRPPVGAGKFLQLLQVFRNDTPTANSPTWVPVGAPVLLPTGVCVVPPSTSGLLAAGVTWPSNPPQVSTLEELGNLGQPTGTPFGGGVTVFALQFNPDGTIPLLDKQRQQYARLVVGTTAQSASGLPQFNNKDAVRGLLIRPTGAITFVNEALGF